MGCHAVEPQQVLNHAVLLLLEHTFLGADRHHRRHFIACDGLLTGCIAKTMRDLLQQDDQHVGHYYIYMYNAACRQRQFAPIGGTDGLGHNLREHQDEEREHARHDADKEARLVGSGEVGRGIACRRRADERRTHRVRNSVDNENGRDRTIDVGLILLETLPTLGTLCLEGGHV